jgi:hypothetical protein
MKAFKETLRGLHTSVNPSGCGTVPAVPYAYGSRDAAAVHREQLSICNIKTSTLVGR